MNDLQSAIIRQYKKTYPQDKLKHISAKTNIQITRVFRILNGSEMKISEYESFLNCFEKNHRHLKIMQALKVFLNHASTERIDFVHRKIQHTNAVYQLKKRPITPYLAQIEGA